MSLPESVSRIHPCCLTSERKGILTKNPFWPSDGRSQECRLRTFISEQQSFFWWVLMLYVVDVPKLYSSVKHSKTNVQPSWGMVQGLSISFDVDIKPWWLSDPESFPVPPMWPQREYIHAFTQFWGRTTTSAATNWLCCLCKQSSSSGVHQLKDWLFRFQDRSYMGKTLHVTGFKRRFAFNI